MMKKIILPIIAIALILSIVVIANPKIRNDVSRIRISLTGYVHTDYFSQNADWKTINYSAMPHITLPDSNTPKDKWIMWGNAAEFWYSQPSYGKYWRIEFIVDDHNVYYWVGEYANQWPPAITGIAPKDVVDIALASLPRINTSYNPIAEAGGPFYYGYAGQPVTFDGSQSYDPDGYIANYTWNFGDGHSGYGKIVNHTYTNPNYAGHYYLVKLTVTDNDGHQAEDYAKAFISPPNGTKPPVAIFTYSPQNPKIGTNIIFDASASYDPDGYITGYTWDFGDGNILSQSFPTAYHSYNKAGVYYVSLEVQDNYKLTTTVTKTIVVASPKYKLEVNTSPEGVGTIVLNPPGGIYDAGTTVTATAYNINGSGYTFDHWGQVMLMGYGINSANSIQIFMDANKTVTAYYSKVAPNQYTLTISVQPQDGGWVEASPPGGVYNYGDTVTLTAHPNAGYKFKEWQGASGGSETTIIMDGNKSVTAVFVKTGGIGTEYTLPFALVTIIAVGFALGKKYFIKA